MADLHLGLIILYPELQANIMPFTDGKTIVLQDDSDGKGPYIKTWNYTQPEPTLEEVITASTSNAALAYVANLTAQFANVSSNNTILNPINQPVINIANTPQPISTGTQTI
jgi:XkdW protein